MSSSSSVLPPVENLAGVAVSSDASRISYNYDSEGRLVGILEHFGPGTTRFTPIRPPAVPRPVSGTTPESTVSPLDDHRVRVEFDLPPSVLAVLSGIAAEEDESLADVVRKATGLYKLSLDARRAGHRIAIVDQDWQVDQEIAGF